VFYPHFESRRKEQFDKAQASAVMDEAELAELEREDTLSREGSDGSDEAGTVDDNVEEWIEEPDEWTEISYSSAIAAQDCIALKNSTTLPPEPGRVMYQEFTKDKTNICIRIPYSFFSSLSGTPSTASPLGCNAYGAVTAMEATGVANNRYIAMPYVFLPRS
jgi:hypothetical protein